MSASKKCTKCGVEKPVDDFNKCKNTSGGRATYCKKCVSRYHHKYYLDNREKLLDQTKEYQKNNRNKVRLYHKKYSEKNQEKLNTCSKKYFKENKDEIHFRHQKNYEENKDEILKRHKEWRNENQDKVKDYSKQWTDANPDKRRAIKSRYRAHKVAAQGSFVADEFIALCKKYGNKCLCCHRTDLALTADHVIPLSKGGSNYIWNIQPLCQSCNSSKNTRSDDYRYDHRFEKTAVKITA